MALLSRLRVSYKLLTIYALDMVAVVFLGASLVEEKYLSINFARRELTGLDYIGLARDSLFALLDRRYPLGGDGDLAAALDRLHAAEARLGAGLDSAVLAEAAIAATAAAGQGQPIEPALDRLRA
ncbi:MAG: hypothetical protein RLZZ501_737, partial [Pseudomonadota bacterium]